MSPVTEKIRTEIAERGAIPFARFMELALYCPLYGFYEKKGDTPGRRGDFYTSVSVGPLFGELLAFQFAAWFKHQPVADGRCHQIVEAGSHDGRLAHDILTWLRLQRPRLFERIEYWIIEPSVARQAWQQATLKAFAPRVRWFADFTSLATSSGVPGETAPVHGVILSNELLDAMPVHRFGWDAQRREWFEWGVRWEQERFVWARLANQSATGHPPTALSDLPCELLAVLPDGFTTEICPEAERWWRAAAGVLQRGKLLTFDYGLATEEFLLPQRAGGTLRAYHRHRLVDDVLADPGDQDLTAHVNFTTIRKVGEASGLRTDLIAPQGQFLTGIVRRAWQEPSGFGPWSSEHTRQFQTLTHPDHLGRSFRALVQSTD